MQVPTATQTLEKLRQRIATRSPLRNLGFNQNEGPVNLSEEDRESHIHILGSTGEGKSKFLEMMVSLDIDALISGKSKSGVCFIDSSQNGNTMRKVLNYCIKRNFQKVLVIDPRHIDKHGYVVPINPIKYKAPSEAIQAHVADSIRVTWQTEDFSQEAVITTYLPYIIDALHSGGYTLTDSECFTIPVLASQRQQILNNPKLNLITRATLSAAFSEREAMKEFRPTARRLNPFYHSVMKKMLGSKEGVNFYDLVTGGWVILANLFPQGVFEERHQRLLGTIIINEILRTISRIKEAHPTYNVPYQLYIDECGHYATKKIADILYYARQSGVRLCLAHQEFHQIKNEDVLAALKSQAKTKVLFYTLSYDDRMAMIKLMYGGELSDREVSYALAQTKKQNAIIKINKASPLSTRLRDWPDVKVSQQERDDYLLNLFKTNPQFYRPKADVWGEMTNRFERRIQPQGGRPVKTSGDTPKSPQPQRPNDGHSDVQVKPPEQKGTGRKLPTESKPKCVPITFVHKRKQDAEKVGGGTVEGDTPKKE